MQIKIGQTDNISATAGTVGGMLIFAYLQNSAVNVTQVLADFVPANVTISVKLMRGGRQYTIFQNNLLLLGTYFMRKNNFSSFYLGECLVPPAGGTAQISQRSAFLKFESPITLRAGDVLTGNVQFLQGALSAAMSTANSYIDFTFQPATTRERGIPSVQFENVTTNINQQNFVNASGIKHIEFLNFDKSSWAAPVMTSASVQSDSLNYAASTNQMIAAENFKWPSNQPYQFGTTQFAPTVARNLNYLPQCLTLYEAGASGVLLNRCTVSGTFDSTQVAASQNWVGSTSIVPTV